MNDFISLNLPKTLDTSTADIIEDFFVPVLARATRYDRGVGFFSSGWLRLTARGMVKFATNGRNRCTRLGALAYQKESDIEVLSDPKKILELAQGWANGGIHLVRDELLGQPGRPLYNLVNMVLD